MVEIPLVLLVNGVDLFLFMVVGYCILSVLLMDMNLAILQGVYRLYYAQTSLGFSIAVNTVFYCFVFMMYVISLYTMSFPVRWKIACLLCAPSLFCIMIILLKRARSVSLELSLSYVVDLHQNIDRYNAESLRKEYGLTIFPVMTYERLCKENPNYTLCDFAKELELARKYSSLQEEVVSTRLQMRWLSKRLGTQTVSVVQT